ncbi:pyridoxal phosphate-dependent aminotransferase [Bacilliculturomica massiliensis]|uniref:pyridoxal phosphate-dependent aminotransferase n=1 Tax=Bacilliculturomica massiliensis TaxID=1917867 RepID=UPI00102F39E3|nr:pyridoxal phosphate-dependent aminotransferase [Bacilliculturomica massiliensis]
MREFLSERLTGGVKVKGLFEIYAMALERQRQGQDVIHMEIGRPDFDTPVRIKEKAKEALDQGLVFYSEPAGLLELRKAITDHTEKQLGLKYNPSTQAIVTVGASEALDLIWEAFLDPEDEVILPSPYYGAYSFQLEYQGKKYVKVPILKEGGKVEYRREDFEAAVTPNTKMILINSPNNPTGYVMTPDEIKMIADFAKEHDLLVVTDDCYDQFVFEGEYLNIATLPGMKERTLIVNSTSKAYAMTGWRVGYVLGNPEYIDALVRIHGQTAVCPTVFAQAGAISAYTEELPETEIMLEAFKERKQYIAEFLRTIDGISYVEPKGAFYIFMDISILNMEGADFCEELIKSKGVTLSPGNNFGLEWGPYVRISYASSMEDIKEAMVRIRDFIAEKRAK